MQYIKFMESALQHCHTVKHRQKLKYIRHLQHVSTTLQPLEYNLVINKHFKILSNYVNVTIQLNTMYM